MARTRVIKGQNADYVVYYGRSGLGLNIERAISESDAIVLEQRANETADFLKESDPGGKVLNAIEKSGKQVPVFLTDTAPIPVMDDEGTKALVRQSGGSLLLWFAFSDAVNIFHEKRRITRREFLMLGGKTLAKAVVGTSLMPLVQALSLEAPGQIGWTRDKMRKWIAFLERNLGQTRYSRLRDALNAVKVETVIAPQVSKGLSRKPKISLMMFWQSHVFLPELLRDPKKAIRIIREERDALKKLDLSHVPMVRRLDWKGQKWRVTDREHGPLRRITRRK